VRSYLIGTILLFVIFFSSAAGAKQHYEDDLQWWVPVTLELQLTEKTSAQLQVESRFTENINKYTLRNFVPSLSYAPNEHVELTLAAGPYFNFHPEIEVEKRIYQQIALKKKWHKLELSLRSRLEERFFEGVGGASLRNRYLLQVKGPIGKTPLYWITSNEIHLNLNSLKDGPQRGLNQNRIYIGVGRKIGKRMSLEGGYQLRINYVIDRPDEMEHIILTRVSYSLH
jgi:hypothetical protein